MEKLAELSHLFVTVFFSGFANFLVIPVIIDVTVAALCSGEDECSLAIYLTGFQQATIGLGTMVMMPLIGNMSDKYGRKAMLTLPMSLSIIPPAILAYRRTRNYFYAHYVVKTLTAMACEGAVDFIALAYAAEKISDTKRTSVFGMLAGAKSISIVFGTIAARFLSVASTFQVATVSSVIGLVYMRVFLKESRCNDGGDHDNDYGATASTLSQPIIEETTLINKHVFKKNTSLSDFISLMKTSKTFSQALVVAFFSSFSASGSQSAFLYFLKARFHFTKNQFADLILLISISGSVSQLVIMPFLASALGDNWLLSIGLLMEAVNMVLVSVSWSAWVPYITTVFIIGSVCVPPSISSIASKEVGLCDQGKAQGCISGVKSFANVVSPFVFSPLTALFLSDKAPFYYPGFSLLCVGLASTIGLIQSLFIKPVPRTSSDERDRNSAEEA